MTDFCSKKSENKTFATFWWRQTFLLDFPGICQGRFPRFFRWQNNRTNVWRNEDEHQRTIAWVATGMSSQSCCWASRGEWFWPVLPENVYLPRPPSITGPTVSSIFVDFRFLKFPFFSVRFLNQNVEFGFSKIREIKRLLSENARCLRKNGHPRGFPSADVWDITISATRLDRKHHARASTSESGKWAWKSRIFQTSDRGHAVSEWGEAGLWWGERDFWGDEGEAGPFYSVIIFWHANISLAIGAERSFSYW